MPEALTMNSADDSSRAALAGGNRLGVAGIVGFGPGVVGGDQFFVADAVRRREQAGSR